MDFDGGSLQNTDFVVYSHSLWARRQAKYPNICLKAFKHGFFHYMSPIIQKLITGTMRYIQCKSQVTHLLRHSSSSGSEGREEEDKTVKISFEIFIHWYYMFKLIWALTPSLCLVLYFYRNILQITFSTCQKVKLTVFVHSEQQQLRWCRNTRTKWDIQPLVKQVISELLHYIKTILFL